MSCTAWRGPIFNDVYNVSRDPGSFLHIKLGQVPGSSGGSKYSVTLDNPTIPDGSFRAETPSTL